MDECTPVHRAKLLNLLHPILKRFPELMNVYYWKTLYAVFATGQSICPGPGQGQRTFGCLVYPKLARQSRTKIPGRKTLCCPLPFPLSPIIHCHPLSSSVIFCHSLSFPVILRRILPFSTIFRCFLLFSAVPCHHRPSYIITCCPLEEVISCRGACHPC